MRFWWIILFLTSFSFAQQQITLCDGDEFTYTYFSQTSDPGNNEWEVNGQFYYTEDLTMTWTDTGTYVINLIRYNGSCVSDHVSYTVSVTKCEDLIYYVPNAFTPDNDDYNQTFTPQFTSGIDIYNFHLMIFNRWGELLFESFNPSKGWNGNYGGIPCQDGVYTWKVDFGVVGTDERISDHGHVVLIR